MRSLERPNLMRSSRIEPVGVRLAPVSLEGTGAFPVVTVFGRRVRFTGQKANEVRDLSDPFPLTGQRARLVTEAASPGRSRTRSRILEQIFLALGVSLNRS